MTITKNVWKAAALLLILCLVSTVMISGTYAKYTSTYAGEDTALVAKWNIVATGGGITMADGGTAGLDLFGHAYDTHVTTSDGGVYIIAPGVSGDFNLQFQNNSDVAASIDFNLATLPGSAAVPIEYSLDGFSTAGVNLAGLQTALNNDFDFNNVAVGATVTKTVDWRWKFTGNPGGDAADTVLGTASAAGANRSEYGLTVTASAVQILPTE